LKLKEGGQRSNPSDMQSKESILAKHLYYDATVTTDFDFRLEAGCQEFLEEKCHIIFYYFEQCVCPRIERERENDGYFHYVCRECKR
jgi:hypothetical protein